MVIINLAPDDYILYKTDELLIYQERVKKVEQLRRLLGTLDQYEVGVADYEWVDKLFQEMKRFPSNQSFSADPVLIARLTKGDMKRLNRIYKIVQEKSMQTA